MNWLNMATLAAMPDLGAEAAVGVEAGVGVGAGLGAESLAKTGLVEEEATPGGSVRRWSGGLYIALYEGALACCISVYMYTFHFSVVDGGGVLHYTDIHLYQHDRVDC